MGFENQIEENEEQKMKYDWTHDKIIKLIKIWIKVIIY